MTNDELLEQIKELSLIEMSELKDKIHRIHYDRKNKHYEENIKQLKKAVLESGLIEKLKPVTVEIKNAKVQLRFLELGTGLCHQVYQVENIDTDPNFIAAREAYKKALEELKALVVKFDTPMHVQALISELSC